MNNIEDFLTHPEFVRWVKQPDKELESYWDQWRKANPELLPTMRIAKEMLLRTSFTLPLPPEEFQQEVLQAVLRQRAKQTNRQKINIQKEKQFRDPNFWDRIGQIKRVAAILILTFGLVRLFGTNTKLIPLLEEEPKEAVTVLKRTGPGEKLQLTLGDGTKVWLNSSSQVEFPENFESKHRLIDLKGEAYFEVEKDSLRPFKVKTDKLLTTVLGTSFNVDARKAGKTKVALVSGEVEVSSRYSKISLAPGDMLNFDNVTGSFDVNGFDSLQVLGWKEGVLMFHRASLREVKEGLEDWYGVEIKLKNARGVNWQVSGEFPNQMLEEVLESMSYIKEFDYKIEDKAVTITF
jgi:ferric-dicitrate binding protein FerR (iron transport regulator)